jgi:hypothetical protein
MLEIDGGALTVNVCEPALTEMTDEVREQDGEVFANTSTAAIVPKTLRAVASTVTSCTLSRLASRLGSVAAAKTLIIAIVTKSSSKVKPF